MNAEKAPSQGDIAKALGISRPTVSRALNNHPGTNEETKVLVRKTAERLGYKKNPLVSLLTAQLRTNGLRSSEVTLAYITTLDSPGTKGISSTYHEFYLGAKQRAEELGYKLDMIWAREKAMTGHRTTKILSSRGIRGIIIAPRRDPLSHISIDWKKFAAASIGHVLPAPHIHLSSAWHFVLMDKVLRMVKKYGYRRIGYAVWSGTDQFASHAFSARYLLYQYQLAESHRVPLIQEPASREPLTRQRFEHWYTTHRPEVILSAGPNVENWLRDMSISVPEEVGLANLCLEDESDKRAGMFEVPRAIAATAIDLVVEQLHNNTLGIPQNPKSVLHEGKWINGRTLRKPYR